MISIIRIVLYHCQITVFIFGKATNMYGTVMYVGLLNISAITVLLRVTNCMGQSHFLKNKSCPASRKNSLP